MMKKLILALLLIHPFLGFSQSWRWVDYLMAGGNHYVFDVAADNNENYSYFCGRYRSSATFYGQNGSNVINPPYAGSRDIFIAKIDSLGEYEWVRTFGTVGSDYASSIIVDEFGDVYVAGEFEGTITFDGHTITSAGSRDVFVAKFSPAGTCLWAKSFGSTGGDFGQSIDCDKNGFLYVGGNHAGVDFDYGSGVLIDPGFFVCKMDYDGNLYWCMGPENNGSSASDLNALEIYNGEIYFAGGFSVNIDIGSFNLISTGAWSDIFYAKMDTSGNTIWAKRIGGLTYDTCNDFAIDDSIIYLVGSYSSTVNFDTVSITSDMAGVGGAGAFNSRDCYVAKLNTDGTCFWVKEHKSVNVEEEYAAILDKKGQLIVTGVYGQLNPFTAGLSEGDVEVTAYDSDGNIVWMLEPMGLNIGEGFALDISEAGSIYFGGAIQGDYVFGDFSLSTSTTFCGIFAKIYPPLGLDSLVSEQFCLGDTAVLSVNGTGSPLNYSWYDSNDQLVLSGYDTNLVVYNVPIEDTLYCIVSNGFETDTVYFAFGFNSASYGTDLGNDISTCESFQLINAGSFGEFYDWGSGAVLFDSLYTVTASGEYIVVVTDSGGCESSDTVIVNLIDCTHIETNLSATQPVILFSNDILNVGSTLDNFQLSIYTIEGKLLNLFTGQFNESYALDITDPGIYLVVLQAEKGEHYIYKLFLE